jgi:predicted PurR-regulated permease PerM
MDNTSWIRYTVILLALMLTVTVLYVAKAVFMPLALAGMLAVVWMPLCKWLERKGVPTVLAALICGLSFACLVGGVFFLVGWHISKITSDVQDIQKSMSAALARLDALMAQWGLKMPKNGMSLLDPAAVGKVTSSLLGIVVDLVLLLVYMIMLLLIRRHIRTFILKLGRPGTNALLDRSVGVVQQYLYGMCLIIGCLWVMYGIGFSLIGVKYALFFAILCGILEIIPFVGNITGSSLTCIMALTQGGGATMVLEIILTYGIIQGIQFYVISPLVMRAQVNLQPLFTIVVLIAGDLLWDIPGMILAIPSLGILKIVLDKTESFQAFGFLLGGDKAKRKGRIFW